ncbi:MAG TPA: oligopeptide:H+ symporter, partial [Sphingomicrobium sp.]|nr:oligopeptide:H+ symporter [Sphingomicrobium sp.]
FGGILIALGHFSMVVEGDGGQSDPTINVFWLALALIIVGTGFLKANISVMVGQLYRLTDMRRDAAYTIFYMGINTGAALGTILVAYLGQTVGWGYGFGLAGIGMVAGLIVFVFGKKVLFGAGEPPAPLAQTKEYTIYGVGIAAIAVIWLLIQYQNVMGALVAISGVTLLLYVLYESFKLPKEPRERMFAILFLIALNPLFWGLFEQAGGSMNLFTDRFVDRSGVPAGIFQAINPIYIILFAPVFAALWQVLGKRGLEPSAPAKFGLALAQMGFANLVLVWGAEAYGVAAMTPVFLVFAYYLFATTAELCLSPVGLSAMNRLAPSFLASLIMGAWFYMTAVGNFVAGKIGEATGGHDGEMSKQGLLDIYELFGWISIGVAVGVLALSPIVKRWMHLDTLRDTRDLAGDRELGEPQAAGTNLTGEAKA